MIKGSMLNYMQNLSGTHTHKLLTVEHFVVTKGETVIRTRVSGL